MFRCLRSRWFSTSTSKFNVIVIGGGHAGSEAASIASRLSSKVALITQSISTIGEMSCNPSFGGVGKSTLIKEIDALGGLMPKAIDQACIHSRVLNRSKGMAVQGMRVQADRDVYSRIIQQEISSNPRIQIIQDVVDDIIVENGRFKGVKLKNHSEDCINADALVLTTGTFLNGRILLGKEIFQGGRYHRKEHSWEPPVNKISRLFNELDIKRIRLRTGTPPRLDGNTINYSACIKQDTEDSYIPMHINHRYNLFEEYNKTKKINCFLTHTTERTKEIVFSNLEQLPDYFESGEKESLPPRYCPSIDAKIRRFTDKASHQIWLEPESSSTNIVFPNGLSTGFPLEVQEMIVNSLVGLENTKIVRPAYSVSYDCVDPRQLKPTLEMQAVEGIYLAGQINGTTGYEEAGAQGIVAGINAAIGKDRQLVLDRLQSMIGVLIDDITSLGLREPYRVFTSRAENRLRIRQDNSYERLSPIAKDLGILTPAHLNSLSFRAKNMESIESLLKETKFSKSELDKNEISNSLSSFPSSEAYRLSDLLSRYNLSPFSLPKLGISSFSGDLFDVSAFLLYSPFEQKELERFEKIKALSSGVSLKHFDWQRLSGIITNEEILVLQEFQPSTLQTASRLPGIRPTTLIAIKAIVDKDKGKSN